MKEFIKIDFYNMIIPRGKKPYDRNYIQIYDSFFRIKLFYSQFPKPKMIMEYFGLAWDYVTNSSNKDIVIEVYQGDYSANLIINMDVIPNLDKLIYDLHALRFNLIWKE